MSYSENDMGLLPIMSPLYNLREICKQIALLEDHLNQPRKRCPDCIRKHFLTIEALFEEAISLDKEYKYGEHLDGKAQDIRSLQGVWIDTKDTENAHQAYLMIAQALRQIRKGFAPMCFDVRKMARLDRLSSSCAHTKEAGLISWVRELFRKPPQSVLALIKAQAKPKDVFSKWGQEFKTTLKADLQNPNVEMSPEEVQKTTMAYVNWVNKYLFKKSSNTGDYLSQLQKKNSVKYFMLSKSDSDKKLESGLKDVVSRAKSLDVTNLTFFNSKEGYLKWWAGNAFKWWLPSSNSYTDGGFVFLKFHPYSPGVPAHIAVMVDGDPVRHIYSSEALAHSVAYYDYDVTHEALLGGEVRVATKTQAEKEDEAAQKLIRKAPKKKPPRKDLRKNRVDMSNDPDLQGVGRGDSGDPDLSRRSQKMASRIARKYLNQRG